MTKNSAATTSSTSTSTGSRGDAELSGRFRCAGARRRPRCCPRGCSPTSPVALVTRARSAPTSRPSPYGIMPRMLVGASERTCQCRVRHGAADPLFMCPDRVIGLCSQDFHGDIAVAKASAQTGVPMVASTLTQGPHGGRQPARRGTPGLFQLYTPTDKELAASFRRARASRYRGVVITLDTWILDGGRVI